MTGVSDFGALLAHLLYSEFLPLSSHIAGIFLPQSGSIFRQERPCQIKASSFVSPPPSPELGAPRPSLPFDGSIRQAMNFHCVVEP